MTLPLSQKQLQEIANQDFVSKDVQKLYGQDTTKDANFNVSTLSSPAPAPKPVTKFNPPAPAADTTRDSFFTSLSGNLDTSRSTLEAAYKQQLTDIQKERDQSQKEIDRLTEMQDTLIDRDVEPLLTPFRENLEKTERKRLYVDENFQANQKLTNELETLLTEGNNLIRAKKEQAIPLSLQNRQLNKTMADISARTGVIQAVMSARSGQIAEAYRMIDRSVDAITADRQDQLNYYKTVFEFYQSQKDDKGQRLITLDKREEDFVQRQIGLLENDLALAQTNAEHIKSLMTSPESAQFMADAGVTLNDTPEQVASKIAEQSRRQEVIDLKNELTAKGYTFVPFPSSTAGLKTFNVGGQTLAFREPASAAPKRSTSVVDLEGRKVLIDTQTGEIITEYGEGDGNGAGTISGKPQTEGQAKANGFADRLLDAESTLRDSDKFGSFFARGGILPNILKTEDRQQFEQAKRNFINSVLRRESGAVISDQEFANAELQYFPQPGDRAGTLALKASNRNTVINNFYREANVLRPVQPGDIIEADGLRYKVAEDGENLIPI